MSDNWITLIPEDPRFVPDTNAQRRARDRFTQIIRNADEVHAEASDDVRFYDCGANFERVLCPSCGSLVSDGWWQDRMSDDDDDGFKLDTYEMPCCRKRHTLHDLKYEWQQGFGRFSLIAMNPGIETVEDKEMNELEEILGTKLRTILRHV
jgi:hypothetical protein